MFYEFYMIPLVGRGSGDCLLFLQVIEAIEVIWVGVVCTPWRLLERRLGASRPSRFALSSRIAEAELAIAELAQTLFGTRLHGVLFFSA